MYFLCKSKLTQNIYFPLNHLYVYVNYNLMNKIFSMNAINIRQCIDNLFEYSTSL